jgi:hypothetical protein
MELKSTAQLSVAIPPKVCEEISDLVLRSAPRARLEGRPQALSLPAVDQSVPRPSFETALARLLRMRAQFSYDVRIRCELP